MVILLLLLLSLEYSTVVAPLAGFFIVLLVLVLFFLDEDEDDVGDADRVDAQDDKDEQVSVDAGLDGDSRSNVPVTVCDSVFFVEQPRIARPVASLSRAADLVIFLLFFLPSLDVLFFFWWCCCCFMVVVVVVLVFLTILDSPCGPSSPMASIVLNWVSCIALCVNVIVFVFVLFCFVVGLFLCVCVECVQLSGHLFRLSVL